MYSFNGCSLWMFFNGIKEIKELRKEINRLLMKGMSNIYLTVTRETNVLKALISKCNKFVTRSVFTRYH